MEARYLRVKNWRDKQHYDPLKRRPPWIKLYNTILEAGDQFVGLSELEQWQLVRLWLVASRSELVTLDEEDRLVPVIAFDEHSLRRSTMSLKRLPLEMFVRDGWLVLVLAEDLVDPQLTFPVASVEASVAASNGASAVASAVVASLASTGASASLSSREVREKRGLKAVALAPALSIQRPTSGGGTDSQTLERIKDACRVDHDGTMKLNRAAKGSSEHALVAALEACLGPGVNDRLAVALSELKKRKEVA